MSSENEPRWDFTKVEDLRPYERNAKKHDKAQIDNVAKSIAEFGMVQPIVIDRDNNVIIGHCRLSACKKLGLDVVPTVKLEDLSPEQANKLRLLDNKLNESEWDFELLAEDIPEIDFTGYEIDFGLFESVNPDDFGDAFSLPDGDKSEMCTVTFTLHESQKALIENAMEMVKDDVIETFGNTNSNGNRLYEVVRQWVELKK